MNVPDIRSKTSGFTKMESDILQQARALVRERNIDVSGLQESLSRYEGRWYVGYRSPEHTGPGGDGWYLSFAYPSGEFIAMSRSQ